MQQQYDRFEEYATASCKLSLEGAGQRYDPHVSTSACGRWRALVDPSGKHLKTINRLRITGA
jgi:hypothetical protein